uniref:30S ribosomal protein S5 n=1 Tax=Nephromyces sp. ex Molgula occidentalis TaxID=2544991 RepID=A0A5C1H7Z8_9APIC|nr:30S ribosomal protein S5 [Nephromyces sp. ex Molgula occidentalis]
MHLSTTKQSLHPLKYFIKSKKVNILQTKVIILINLLSNILCSPELFNSLNVKLFCLSINVLDEYNILLSNLYSQSKTLVTYKLSLKELKHKIIHIKFISKMTKKGRIKKIKLILIIGNETGWIGIGISKANTFNDAVSKAFQSSFKNIYLIPRENLNGTYKYKNNSIFIKPQKLGFGIKSSFILKWLLELAGYKNFTIKLIGSKNNLNSIYTFLQLCIKIPLKSNINREFKNLREIQTTELVLLQLIKNLNSLLVY